MAQAASQRYEGLSPEEWRLLSHMREIPLGPIRAELIELVGDLVAFVHDPRCPEAQGDGVPCLSLAVACEQCRQVADVLASLHQRLRRA